MPACSSCRVARATWAQSVTRSVRGTGRPRFGRLLVRLHLGGVLELLRRVEGGQRVDQLVDRAIEHALQLVRREVDAMVGDAALRKVVGANLLRAFAGADL